MKPVAFDYAAPASLDEALGLLAGNDDALVIAGGQSLMPLLNMRLARPSLVIDIARIAELRTWQLDDDALRVGAAVTAAEIEESDHIRAALPLLTDALALVGHPQIRNRTTIGGSIAHADPASELPAVLLALEGSVELASPGGVRREVAAADFFTGPFSTAKRSDEIVVRVCFPRVAARAAITEIARRPGDFAVVGAVAVLAADAGTVTDLRLALFGVGGRAVRVPPAEAAARGQTLGEQLIDEVAALVRGHVDPQSDVHGSADYRRAMSGVLVGRLLRDLKDSDR